MSMLVVTPFASAVIFVWPLTAILSPFAAINNVLEPLMYLILFLTAILWERIVFVQPVSGVAATWNPGLCRSRPSHKISGGVAACVRAIETLATSSGASSRE